MKLGTSIGGKAWAELAAKIAKAEREAIANARAKAIKKANRKESVKRYRRDG